MASQPSETIAKYEVLFSGRTGVTVLMQKHPVFDGGVETKAEFKVSPDTPGDVILTGSGKPAVLKGLRKDYLDEAVERGIIMFYEMQDEEVVRCTPCNFKKK